MSKIIRFIFLILLCALFAFAQGKNPTETNRQTGEVSAQQKTKSVDGEKRDTEKAAVAETTRLIAEIVDASFPELHGAKFSVKIFHSRSDYFRSRFSFGRFFTFRKLHFIIFVNPLVFERNAPIQGIRAIIALELAHTAYYKRHNRFELFGLIGLKSKSFTRFERGADLQAIKHGYGAGLKQYREWLYQNIPAEKISAKKRDYFSPAEIELILEVLKDNPKLIDFLIKRVPRNQVEIQVVIDKKTAKKE